MMMPNYARQVPDPTNLFDCRVDNISSYPQNKGEPLPKRQPLIEISQSPRSRSKSCTIGQVKGWIDDIFGV